MNALDLLTMLVGYLLGSIPFGLLLTKLAGHGDIRAIGSGNIGATNVLRTGNKALAAATLLLDGLKGAGAVWIGVMISPCAGNAAALAALIGHMFPVWLKFKGGKGVATLLGATIALSWPVAVMAMLTWLATALLVRISSAAALVSIVSMPLYAEIFGETQIILLLVIMGLLVIAKHTGNIIRLVKGTEPHIGDKRDAEKSA